MLLDKNPEQDFEMKIKPILEKNNLSSILCNKAFLKASFLEKIVQNSNVPIYYLDFDLLYSGFISGGILSKKDNVQLYNPTSKELQNTLQSILENVSKEKSIVIIDSLNGLNNLFEEKDAGRLINSYIMLLAFVAQNTNSQIILASIARMKDKEFWVLSPTGRQIIISEFLTSIQLKQNDSTMILNLLDDKNSTIDSIEISS